MKRLIIVVLVSLVFFGNARAQNLFTNSGFEDGTTRWTNFWAQTGSLSTERFHSGKSSAKIAHAESKESGWSQSEIKGLEAGAVYKVEVYAYRAADTVSAKIWLLTGWWHTGAP
ncbi:MAG: carbohydrate binding domain-containing protein, partial [Chloroflexi bacterium]|nr:carbohydrate binding domain-containing protein [Chloroflexota bacterium]